MCVPPDPHAGKDTSSNLSAGMVPRKTAARGVANRDYYHHAADAAAHASKGRVHDHNAETTLEAPYAQHGAQGWQHKGKQHDHNAESTAAAPFGMHEHRGRQHDHNTGAFLVDVASPH